MSSSHHGRKTYQPRQHHFGILAAFDEYVAARKVWLDAKTILQRTDLTPTERGNLERIHDNRAEKVTSTLFALNTAIDASEDA